MPRRRNSGPDGGDAYFSAADRRALGALLDAFGRLSRRSQIAVVALLAVVGLVALAVYVHVQNSVPGADANLLLGNPSNAVQSLGSPDNYLMVKPYFTLSYNNSAGEPNWVSWEVSDADLGDAPRARAFETDPTLPVGFEQVTSSDYTSSGFDRGHMCPHGDRAADVDMSYATFVMTNVIPQAPNVNRKAWAQLEEYCRELVRRENDHLYVVAGPLGRGGVGERGFRNTIGRGKVVVPAECWKIIVVVPRSGGGDDLLKINAGTRVIAVVMPNDQDQVGETWAQFRTSTADVEARTGFHFFSKLPPDVAQALRQKVDDTPIPPPKPAHYHD